MLHFCGDINLTDWNFNVGFGIGSDIRNGLDPLKYLERRNDDIWIGNFEGVTSDSSINKGINAHAFRIEPRYLKKVSHMDIYGLANNHAMEHGGVAYNNTVEALESFGCTVFGSNIQRSAILIQKGQKISITGISFRLEESKEKPLYWHNPEYKEIEKEISILPNDAFKILYVHWGNEYINRPSASQKKFAHWLIDSGFDLIIGMHPHVLQGYEIYNGKRIYYSLGNCVFDMPSEQCSFGAIIGLDFSNKAPIYSEQYIKIDDYCCPHIVSETEIPKQWRFEFLNTRLEYEDNSEFYHKEIKSGYTVYRMANWKRLIKAALIHPRSFIEIFKDFFKRRIIKAK